MNRLLILVILVISSAATASSQLKPNPDFFEYVKGTGGAGGGSGVAIEQACAVRSNPAALRILIEYGAVFSAADTVTRPPTCVFDNEESVAAFQKSLRTGLTIVGGVPLMLQKAAADSLNSVVEEAARSGIRIRPLDGAIAGGRTYSDTLRLWNSRFDPALRFWRSSGKIEPAYADLVMSLPQDKRIELVAAWEKQGLLFGTARRTSIFASVAPPGASQHLSLIAIDIVPPISPAVRSLMNAHGWFQTVKGDVPHFTFLGVAERDLPGRGLKAVIYKGTQYWVPNISSQDLLVNRPN